MQNLTSPILERRALAVLRIAVAVLIILHGVARVWLGIVDDFGTYLDGLGFSFGLVLAWIITVVEIVGGVALAAGFFVRPLAIWFTVQLLAGVALIHFAEGWFVVGAGRNGMEYSVLLIVALVLLAWTNVGRNMSGAAGL